MIVFGCSITSPDMYREAAEPGFDLVREPDSVVMANAAAGSLMRSYNLIMDRAAEMDGVEALVLCHQDAELTSPDFCSIIRRTLEDPGRRRDRMRRRPRRAQHRLVGGVGDLGLVHPPLQGVRRRTDRRVHVHRGQPSRAMPAPARSTPLTASSS